MNNVSINKEKEHRQEGLKYNELEEKDINEFRSKIKKVSKEESKRLGKELYDLITKKDYKDNDKTKVIELIYKGADVNYKEETKGNFPLLVCARKNYLMTFLALIRGGANIDQCNYYRTTATMASARHGNLIILKLLIAQGADINKRCIDGDNALFSAKRHNKTECFNLLVKAQAYLNNKNILNQTILDIDGNENFDIPYFRNCTKETKKDTSLKEIDILLKEAQEKMLNINNIEMIEKDTQEISEYPEITKENINWEIVKTLTKKRV